MTGHDPDLMRRAMRRYAERFGVARFRALTDAQLEALPYTDELMLRPEQMEPDVYQTLVLLAGRGGGKNFAGSRLVQRRVKRQQARRIVIVGRTSADTRDTIVRGPSGILTTSPPWDRPLYEPSKRLLTWSNGSEALLCSAEAPDQLRGPGADLVLCDEFAAWEKLEEAWMNVEMILREGNDPKLVITSTPRPLKLLQEIIADPGTVLRRWSTYDNVANLAPAFVERMKRRYEGTRLGRQELHAEILGDAEGALWTWAMIEASRLRSLEQAVDGGLGGLDRVVVGVDPSVSAGSESAETGIVVVGRHRELVGENARPVASSRLFVLADRSVRDLPGSWARRAIAAYHEFRADEIVAEANNGGELVRHVLREADPSVPVRLVYASRGKQTRAEPVSMLWEQRRAFLVGDPARDPETRHTGLEDLESQMTSWIPGRGKSPDRIDAMVWACTALMDEIVYEPADVETDIVSADTPRGRDGERSEYDPDPDDDDEDD